MSRKTPTAYATDLAFIHDAGFGDFAREASAFLIEILRQRGISRGLVVDFGSGSGILAECVSKADYEVLGFDVSRAMIELASKRVPTATFRHESFLDAQLPPCVAVTAIGEIFNYLFDRRNTNARLRGVFRRVHAALRPGGVFVFDVALVGRVPEGIRRGFTAGPDWACLYEACEDPLAHTLERRITSFRKVGEHYRRDAEVHRLRLYRRAPLLADLRAAGFRARTLAGYGATPFPPGYAGFVARKA
jgi:SAM-dependent methyltransferase